MQLFTLAQRPFWRFRQPWSDHVKQFDYLDWESQRKLAYKQIDKGGFGYWSVVVAGLGFLTDAYDIFAVNTVLPMLDVVYWNSRISTNQRILISLSMLVGTFVGQLLFGILADRYGRKRMYGYELLVLTGATVLMSVASKGALAGTNRLAWIMAWRFIMGVGVGGDYPLSAIITAEFAPRKHRGRMISTLFFMQAIGALLANIVTIIAINAASDQIPKDISPANCVGQCAEAIDHVWRWIVGLGAVPPSLGILLRWWIPESPRYTLEVDKDPNRATKDVNAYYKLGSDTDRSSHDSNHPVKEIEDTSIPIGEPSQAHQDPLDRSDSQPYQHRTDSLEQSHSHSNTYPSPISFGELTKVNSTTNIPIGSISSLSPNNNHPTSLRKETWSEFFIGFFAFLRTDSNWTDLAGTSLSWMVLDFAFYALSVNSPKILSKLWDAEQDDLVYHILISNGYRALIAVSTGALLGGAAFIFMARWRWHLQLYGFWVLAIVFVITGVMFVTLINTKYFAAVIVMYGVCNLFVNLGPNTSTFVIAAEVFPTKYRGTCHGISAAAGKLGSIIAQVFLSYVKFGGLRVSDPEQIILGWVFLVFAAWMVFGAIITQIWVPNPTDHWGRSRRLEDLGKGKKARKRLEKEELDIWEGFVLRQPLEL